MNDRREGMPAGERQSDLPEPSGEMVALYQRHMPQYIDQMKSALAAGDAEAVFFQCHKMASAVKIMGFDNIAELLEKVQKEKPTGTELGALCSRIEKLVGHTLTLLGKP